MNEKRKAIVQTLRERWDPTGLLRGIKGEHAKDQMIVLLDNQAKDNEEFHDVRLKALDEALQARYPQFMRTSIPIVRRVYHPDALLAFRIASVQAMLEDEDTYSYRDVYGVLREREVVARARALRTESLDGSLFERHDPDIPHHSLDDEAEACALVSEAIAAEINAEVVGDIATNAATRMEHAWRGADELRTVVGLAAGQVYRKTHKDANWIVTSNSLAYELLGGNVPESFTPSTKPVLAGTWNGKYQVYAFGEGDDVLLGHKGDDYGAGYFYCPKVPVFVEPEIVTEDGKHPYMTRYGKSMPFPEYFGLVTVTGRPSETKED